MIVVAIIGILAAIAIPNFLRFQLKAKSSEGKTNLAAIRTAEESYYSEFGVYVSALVTPTAYGQNQKVVFDNSLTNGNDAGFDRLGWSPEGYVFFNYAIGCNAGFSQWTGTAAADIDAGWNGPGLGLQEGRRCRQDAHLRPRSTDTGDRWSLPVNRGSERLLGSFA
jgi:type IV pilus assembly protein PilA